MNARDMQQVNMFRQLHSTFSAQVREADLSLARDFWERDPEGAISARVACVSEDDEWGPVGQVSFFPAQENPFLAALQGIYGEGLRVLAGQLEEARNTIIREASDPYVSLLVSL